MTVDAQYAWYLDRLYEAKLNITSFAVQAYGPGMAQRLLYVEVLDIRPPVGKQRKPQVIWRWEGEDEERTCSIGSFRRFTTDMGGSA